MTTKVLIISVGIGSGHNMVANALSQKIKKRSNIDVKVIDILDFLPHRLVRSVLSLYIWILTYIPSLYNFIYKFGNKQGSLWMRDRINNYLYIYFKKNFDEWNFTTLYCTHATACGIAALYKKTHPDIHLFGVVTDFTVHSWWYYPEVDKYHLAHEDIQQDCLCDAKRSYDGIPLRDAFLEKNKYVTLKGNLVICGGGFGILPMKQLVSKIQHIMPCKWHIQVFCGKNKNLYWKMKKYEKYGVDIFEFSESFPSYLYQAEIILTKPGGVTIAEALCSKGQLYMFDPLPGQETANALFAVKHGWGQIVRDVNDFINILKKKVDE